MFLMSPLDVEPSVEEAALRLVSRSADLVVGPVNFGGVRFWAAVDLDRTEIARRHEEGVAVLDNPAELQIHLSNGRPPPVRLHGCLVREHKPASSLQHASLLAGYTARSILIDDTDDVLAVMVDAAVLDQGVIVRRADGWLDVLGGPGPRVPGHGLDVRELSLLESVYGAWLSAGGGPGAVVDSSLGTTARR